MLSTEVTPPYETMEIGTPRDYTTDLYRVYFELGHITKELEALFTSFSREPIVILSHIYFETRGVDFSRIVPVNKTLFFSD